MSWEEHQDRAFGDALDHGVPLDEAIHEVYGFDPGTKRGQTGIRNELKRMEPQVAYLMTTHYPEKKKVGWLKRQWRLLRAKVREALDALIPEEKP